jgi:hypothetical protein
MIGEFSKEIINAIQRIKEIQKISEVKYMNELETERLNDSACG